MRTLQIRYQTVKVSAILALVTCFGGCQVNPPESETARKKPPRPVKVETLRSQPQQTSKFVTAVAESWKTEQIGFEVGGRIVSVVEPNTDIEGHIVDPKNDTVIIQGTPIARIDDEKYRLQVEKAKAELNRANQAVAAAKIEIDKSLPAQETAANADLELAKLERERRQRLVQKKAGAQADADKADANFKNAKARLEQLQATKKAKLAELESLKLQVQIATQALKEAQRDLDNCVLYSSFRGQIAATAVVPGSVVQAGNPVATVQLMNPIKVTFEASALESRRLQKRQRVPVTVRLPEGKSEILDGFVYSVAPAADLATRTFTVTVLLINRNISSIDENGSIPTIDQTWPLTYEFLPGAKDGMLFAPEEAILTDEKGDYVWRVTDMGMGDNLPADGVVSVKKMRVTKQTLKLPFLGSWLFHHITVNDKSFTTPKSLIAGKLNLSSEQAAKWTGTKLKVVPARQWMLRPGDLVKVDVAGSGNRGGFFVPMDAIVYDNQKTYLMIVSRENDLTTVKRHQVVIQPQVEGQSTSAIRQVSSFDQKPMDGFQFVTKGAHYLTDGQEIQIINEKRSIRPVVENKNQGTKVSANSESSK